MAEPNAEEREDQQIQNDKILQKFLEMLTTNPPKDTETFFK